MASAVDTRQSTNSPSTRLSKISAKDSPTNPRRNPVAREVPIIATGARHSENDGQRGLFTEDTTTALVFPNGGVLRLSAKVASGQLLFLTHKETKREVVAQVTRQGDSQQASPYVEVEFSEPSPGFWGVEFPETPPPANAGQKEADAPLQPQEVLMGKGPRASTPAPSAQEVTALKTEVEALREQVKQLQTQTAAGNSALPTSAFDLARPAASKPQRALADVLVQAGVLAPAPGQAAEQPAAEVLNVLASDRVSPGTDPSLPVEGGEAEFSEEALLPEPALNLKEAKRPTKPDSIPKETAAEKGGSAAMRKDLLFAAFVIVTAAAAWYQNLLPSLHYPKNSLSSSTPNFAPHPVSPAAQRAGKAGADSGKSPNISQTPETRPVPGLPNASEPAKSGARKPSTFTSGEMPADVNPVPNAAADAGTERGSPEAASDLRKQTSVAGANDALASEAPPSGGAGVVPPKLIKAVRAVARPDALQDFSSGSADNVTFDVLVDTSGYVKFMKPLTGPAYLRNAAIEALKQYRYEPATRHGKPVPAHVVAKIKFLFEP